MHSDVSTASTPLEDVAEMLREQLREAHHFVKECFADAASANADDDMQTNAMKLAARLMQACATTAAAVARLEGNRSRQDIVVSRESLTSIADRASATGVG